MCQNQETNIGILPLTKLSLCGITKNYSYNERKHMPFLRKKDFHFD